MVHYPRIARHICVIAAVIVYTVLICCGYRSACRKVTESIDKRSFTVADIQRLSCPVVHFSIDIYSIFSVPRCRERRVPLTGKVKRLAFLNIYFTVAGCRSSVSRTAYDKILTIVEFKCRKLIVTL